MLALKFNPFRALSAISSRHSWNKLQTRLGAFRLHRPDTILRHQFLRIGIILGDAGGNYSFAFFNLGGDGEVQGKELGEQILFGAEAVGGEAGGVQRGVGVLERIRAGQFERAIEGANAAKLLDAIVCHAFLCVAVTLLC